MILASFAVAVATLASASTEAPARTVNLTLESDGKLIGAPTVTVISGETATLRTDHYVLTVRVDDQPTGARRVATTVKLMRKGRWTPVAAPTVTLMPGHSARAETRDAGGIPFRLEVSAADVVAAR